MERINSPVLTNALNTPSIDHSQTGTNRASYIMSNVIFQPLSRTHSILLQSNLDQGKTFESIFKSNKLKSKLLAQFTTQIILLRLFPDQVESFGSTYWSNILKIKLSTSISNYSNTVSIDFRLFRIVWVYFGKLNFNMVAIFNTC